MSEEIKCIRCSQPDIPFEIFYIYFGHVCIKVRYDPFTLDVLLLSREKGEKEIKKFDAAMNGEELKDG